MVQSKLHGRLFFYSYVGQTKKQNKKNNFNIYVMQVQINGRGHLTFKSRSEKA